MSIPARGKSYISEEQEEQKVLPETGSPGYRSTIVKVLQSQQSVSMSTTCSLAFTAFLLITAIVLAFGGNNLWSSTPARAQDASARAQVAPVSTAVTALVRSHVARAPSSTSVAVTPRAAAGQTSPLSVTFVTTQVIPHAMGVVTVHTAPGASLTIAVAYCSNRHFARIAGLKGQVIADQSGNYTWNWTPKTNCRSTATVIVTALLNDQAVSNSAVIQMQ